MKEYTIVQDDIISYHHGYYCRLYYLLEEKQKVLAENPESNWWLHIPMFRNVEGVDSARNYIDWLEEKSKR
jgi:hypothetical protein